MGNAIPFGHLKHKLWSKEKLGVKLTIWLPTTKSHESIQFPYVQVACDISLKSSQPRLQLFFGPHCYQRFAHEVMHPQSCGSPSYGNFGIPTWESWDKKSFGMWSPWKGAQYTIRGKVAASPKFELWWVLWVRGRLWFVLTPKVLQLCTNHFVLVLCKFAWVIEAYQFFLVPSWNSSKPLYPSKVLRAKENAPTLYSSVVFSLDSHLNPSKSWDHVNLSCVLSPKAKT
jgi:hypothetical protein